MSNRCDFDSIQCRWIDERVPVLEPQKVLAQAIRCYSPADFLLLLEGTGLIMKHIEVDGQELDAETNTIATSGPLMNAWCYLVQLVFNSKPTSVSQPS